MLTKLQPETINDLDYPSITVASTPDKLLNNIKLEFSYPVYFTEDIFNPVNLQLVNVFSAHATEKSPVCVFLDQGIVDKNSDLLSQIDNYFNSYRSRLKQLGTPMLIPGVKSVKQIRKFWKLSIASFTMKSRSTCICPGYRRWRCIGCRWLCCGYHS